MKRLRAIGVCGVLALAACACLLAGSMSGCSSRSLAAHLDALNEVATQAASLAQAYSQDAPAPVNVNLDNYSERALAPRGYYSDTNTAKDVTVMLYVCGSDLESDSGSATADIQEILENDIGANMNFIIQTGGTKKWNNNTISALTDQRWRATAGGLEKLEDIGLQDMSGPSTLEDFIAYSAATFPADRYMLILWDHGGGTSDGYGYDQNFSETESMSIAEIGSALKGAGVKFDIVGFDACLMATAETAFMLEPYADYLIASQKVEPWSGWDYSNWVQKLADKPSVRPEKLAKTICDDYVAASVAEDKSAEATLSLIDLTKLPALIAALDTFASSIDSGLGSELFSQISQARADCGVGRNYEDYFDLVDISYLASRLQGVADGDTLAAAVSECVAYNATSRSVKNSNGLNIYFPYTYLSQFPAVTKIYSDIGFNKAYVSFLADFVSVMAGGQDSGSGAWQGYDWFNAPLYNDYGSYYEENSTDSSQLQLTESNGEYVLSLTDEQWGLITTIEQKVYLDDGTGYVDLGNDNFYEFDEAGNLRVTFDNHWLALNGTTVCFFFADEDYSSEDAWYTTGYVPAEVNGEDVQIVLRWDADHKGGYVPGYLLQYDTGVSSRVTEFKRGDKISYLCDFYDYDGNFDATYYWGDEFSYKGELKVSYESIGDDATTLVCYQLTDIYGNKQQTQLVECGGKG